AVPDIDARGSGASKEKIVEGRAIDVQRPAGTRHPDGPGFTLPSPVERRPPLDLVPAVVAGEDSQARQEVGALRQQALPDVESRELLSLDQDYVVSAASQKGSEDGTRRSATDDQDVVHAAAPLRASATTRSSPSSNAAC